MVKKAAYYIHWPYCSIKCPYCDFNSHRVELNTAMEHDYLSALLVEMEYYYEQYGARQLSSIYFGGGTPSLMRAETVHAILDKLQQYYSFVSDIEITLEVNPASYIREKFLQYRDIGVNRISIGVQSFDEAALRYLGRAHDRTQAIEALQFASEIFDNYTFDLIYARAGQRLADWEKELQFGLSFGAKHLSLYELVIEEGTKFATLVRNGKMDIMGDEEAAQFYLVTQDIMDEAKRPAYEISNHAMQGYESRHNLSYWNYEEYLAIGPGAHSRIHLDGGIVLALRNEPRPKIWQMQLENGANAISEYEILDNITQAKEILINAMRLKNGVYIKRFEAIAGSCFDSDVVEKLKSEDLIWQDNDRLKPTRKGMLFIDYIIEKLSSVLN